jgi:hypothetical protein
MTPNPQPAYYPMLPISEKSLETGDMTLVVSIMAAAGDIND